LVGWNRGEHRLCGESSFTKFENEESLPVQILLSLKKISAKTVQSDFNALEAVIHYTRAAHELGLWKSEHVLIERFFPEKSRKLIEAGCGAGRVTLGLWKLGYRNLTAFDFAEELVDQAKNLALERKAGEIAFFHDDATQLGQVRTDDFEGALFLFNGLMQIPGRENRRKALLELNRVCRADAPLIFTTHDRDATPTERALWRLESARWERGEQDIRLVEFGDRYFEDESGRTFMHLPNRAEIIEDLRETGWNLVFDEMRRNIAEENRDVRNFSDECRFWVARK